MSTSQSTTNTMLSFPQKKTTSLDLYSPLRAYIVSNYYEPTAVSLEPDLTTVNTLRATATATTASSSSLRDSLIQYIKTLILLENRFPISPSKDHINSVHFTWFDAFKVRNKSVQANIHLEKAAVLFNLGAVCCELGLGFDRSDGDGRKNAVHCFVMAAGVLAYLRDFVAVKVGENGTVDVSVECVGMLERLMLAQAQECCFEGTIARGSSHGASAKIARQVGIYYEEALAALNVAPLNQHFDKAWIAHVQLKASLFYAEACYRYSLELHEKEEIAQEIVRLTSGLNALSGVKKTARAAPALLLEAASNLEASLNRNLERAMKENDRVYLQRVPPASSLPPLPAFSMVKPLPMDEILDASKEKLFLSLIPHSSTKALSRYTEMVDEVIRTQAEKLQQGSELARVRLNEMNLPESLLSLEGNLSLPDSLKEDVEAVQICGGPAGFEAELQQLKDLRRVNDELLVQTDELLEKEAREDAEFRNQFGSRWTRPQSSTLTKNLKERLNRFAGNLKQAGDSDAKIENSIRDNSSLMSILDCHPIEAALPSLAKPIMSLDANEDAVVGALKQTLRQLETLGAQRAGLEDLLKEMKTKDDILPKLMISTGSYEDLYKKEISKYDQICEEIAQNLEAQEQLLVQIQAQNDQFAALFNLEDYKASQEKCLKQIEAAIAKYREIKENVNEGLKFYITLQDAITNVKQQASDFVMTRNIQCRDMIDGVQRQVSGLNLQDLNNYTYSSFGSGLSRPPARTMSSDIGNTAQSSGPQPPYYQPSQNSSIPGYGPTAYGSSQQPHQPHYHQLPPQHQQSPAEYGQPTYPGWQGPNYNAQSQQPGSYPRPPYTIPGSYPNQSGNYKPQ